MKKIRNIQEERDVGRKNNIRMQTQSKLDEQLTFGSCKACDIKVDKNEISLNFLKQISVLGGYEKCLKIYFY